MFSRQLRQHLLNTQGGLPSGAQPFLSHLAGYFGHFDRERAAKSAAVSCSAKVNNSSPRTFFSNVSARPSPPAYGPGYKMGDTPLSLQTGTYIDYP